MPKLTRKTGSVEARKPFGVYDGPLPPRGVYPCVIRSVSVRVYDSGTQAFNIFVVIEAPEESPKAEFNGYGFFVKLFLGEHEAQLAREGAFYLAVCGKQDADIVLDKDPKPGQGGDAKVTKIGGKDPVGTKVRVDLRLREYPVGSGQYDREGDSIYAYDENSVSNAQPKSDPDADPDATPAPAAKAAPAKRAARKAPAAPAPAAEEVTVDSEPADEAPEDDVDYGAMTLPALKAAARAKGIDPAGKKKSDLIDELADLRGVNPGSDDESNPAAEWGEDDVPPANEVEALTDDQFWAWADTKFEDDLATLQESSRQEIFDMMVEDGVVAPF